MPENDSRRRQERARLSRQRRSSHLPLLEKAGRHEVRRKPVREQEDESRRDVGQARHQMHGTTLGRQEAEDGERKPSSSSSSKAENGI